MEVIGGHLASPYWERLQKHRQVLKLIRKSLGSRSSLLKGDPLSIDGQTCTHESHHPCAMEATSAGTVAQWPTTGSMASFSSHEKPLIGRKRPRAM